MPLITCAASLAHYGLLGPLEVIYLNGNYVDLSTVPLQHLAALVFCVTEHVNICDFNDCDLVTLLDSIKSKSLNIFKSRSLGREETRALVRAMETRVERVGLDSFDAEALSEYSGQGRCWEFSAECIVKGNTAEQLKAWAKSRDWIVKYKKWSRIDGLITLNKPGVPKAMKLAMRQLLDKAQGI